MHVDFNKDPTKIDLRYQAQHGFSLFSLKLSANNFVFIASNTLDELLLVVHSALSASDYGSYSVFIWKYIVNPWTMMVSENKRYTFSTHSFYFVFPFKSSQSCRGCKLKRDTSRAPLLPGRMHYSYKTKQSTRWIFHFCGMEAKARLGMFFLHHNGLCTWCTFKAPLSNSISSYIICNLCWTMRIETKR